MSNTYTLNKDLVLLRLIVLDRDTLGHLNLPNALLTQEVANLDATAVASDDQVDGEVCVHCTHLVLEANRHTLEHVDNCCLGGTKTSKVLAAGVPDNELELGALRALNKTEVHGHVTEVLGKYVRAYPKTGTSDPTHIP